MNKVNENIIPDVMSGNCPHKKFEWSIEVDKHLGRLFESACVEDPGEQWAVCEALCVIGLAEHQLFGEDTDTVEFQEDSYTSTKRLRNLLDK